MANILDGKKIADKIKAELREKVNQFSVKPCLAVVLVGDNPASKVYVSMKEIACEEVNIKSEIYQFDENVKEKKIIDLIKELNNNSQVHGILVQLPLPKQINEFRVIKSIHPLKDVDGFHPENSGQLFLGEKRIVPCTALGILRLIKEYGVSIKGKKAIIVGRSNIVGKPTALLLLENNATITICHSKTENLKEHTLQGDIIVAACGVPKVIKKDMVKPGAVVIDVGVNQIKDSTKKRGYHVCGDVDFDEVKEIASGITPVPGGIGPMTVAMLMENTFKSMGLLLDQKRGNNE